MPGITDALTQAAFQIDSPVNPNDRVTVTDQGDAQFTKTSFLGRIWSCITRSLSGASTEKDANKAAAQQFIQELENQYGPHMANMARQDLKSQLAGSPLTVRRVALMTDKYAEMNAQIGNSALQRAFGHDQAPNFLKPGLLSDPMLEMRLAIAADPSASPRNWRGNEQGYIEHCASIGQRYLENAAMEALMPQSMQLTHGGAMQYDTFAAATRPPNLTGITLGEHGQFMDAYQQMKNTAAVITSLKPGESISAEDRQTLVQFALAVEKNQLGLTGLQNLSPNGEKLRGALQSDMQALTQRTKGLLGL